MAGYSQTPLVKKLGLKEENRFFVSGLSKDYTALIGEFPTQAIQVSRLSKNLDFIHYFTKSREQLESFIPKAINYIKRDGVIWISWPKKASRIASDVSEDTIREIALPLGLVDVKVCAIDDIWSGLKLVIRKELR